MSDTTRDLDALEQRLETLETQNRRIKRGGIAVLLLAGAGLLMGQAAPGKVTLEAQRIVIVDQDGKARASLGVNERGVAGLTLLDVAGEQRALLALARDGSPALRLSDPGQQVRVHIGPTSVGQAEPAKSGGKPVPYLMLLDREGHVAFEAP
jgi:hypothetical protein